MAHDNETQDPYPALPNYTTPAIHRKVSKMIIMPYEPYEPPRRQYGMRTKTPLKLSQGGEQGVLLEKALNPRLVELDDANDPVFEDCGTKITYVIQFPGYPPFKKQKYSHTRKRGNERPFSRAKVAQQVAQVMSEFLTKMEYVEVGADGPLRLGEKQVNLSHVYLLELHHVSQASFQPVFGVLRDEIPRAAVLIPQFLEPRRDTVLIPRFLGPRDEDKPSGGFAPSYLGECNVLQGETAAGGTVSNYRSTLPADSLTATELAGLVALHMDITSISDPACEV